MIIKKATYKTIISQLYDFLCLVIFRLSNYIIKILKVYFVVSILVILKMKKKISSSAVGLKLKILGK